VFRDTIPEEGAETFLNMVIYCTKSTANIEFRMTTNEDYLGSMARRKFLPPDESLEMQLVEIGGQDRRWTHEEILQRGNESIVEEYHSEAAIRHWEIMRTVMPAGIWELW
jgi:hypothetical protein